MEINLTELNEIIDLAMEKAQGNYHNLIDIVSKINKMNKEMTAIEVVKKYKSQRQAYQETLDILIHQCGFSVAVIFVQMFALQTG